MREIEFRGKSLTTHEWLFGSHFTDGSEDYIIPQNLMGINDYENYQVDQNTVGQFTGYGDANNVRIYEGDVLHVFIHEYDQLGRFKCKTDMPPYLRGVVEYNENQCKFQILLEENTQCGDRHILSCEFGWGHERFLVVGKFAEMPFKLERDRDYKKGD